MVRTFLTLALMGYFGASSLWIAYFLSQREVLYHWGVRVMGVALVSHTGALILGVPALGRLPVATLGEALLLLSWVLAGVFLAVDRLLAVRVLGALAAPLVAVMVSGSLLLPGGQGHLSPLLNSFWVHLHAGLAFLGVAALSLAGLAGLLYLVQEHQIKGKRFGFFFRRLPSLEHLDTLNHWCLTLGFPLLTLGIIVGALYAQYHLGSFFNYDPKEISTLLAWLIYAVLLHERLAVGWRGRRAAFLALCGFGVLIITLVGAGLWFGGYHSFASFRGVP
jgi:cytochrome c-type biogenesis protein CcsB